LRIGASATADGSAYVEQGNTKLLVTVSGPHEAKQRKNAVHDSGLLTVEVSTLPFAGGQHKAQGRTDRGSIELGAAIRKTFEPVIQMHLYPKTQIDVAVCILQSDGGVRSAAINAVTLALVDAGVA
jgi:exosome complex component RRP41